MTDMFYASRGSSIMPTDKEKYERRVDAFKGHLDTSGSHKTPSGYYSAMTTGASRFSNTGDGSVYRSLISGQNGRAITSDALTNARILAAMDASCTFFDKTLQSAMKEREYFMYLARLC